MKKYGILLVVLLTTVVLVGSAMAGRGRAGRGKIGRMRGMGPQRVDCFKKLDLTEEQQAKIDSLRAAAKEAAKDAETREERQRIFRRMRNAIEGVLTEEQLAELKECREQHRGRRGGPHGVGPGGPQGFDCFRQLDLTEEQQAKIDSLRAAAREAAKDAETREERQQIFKRMRNAIEGVLTEAQLAELKECREQHRGRHGGPLGFDCLKQLDLTEEQQAKIDSLRAAAREAAKDAETREERQRIFKRMHNAIKDVLTEEQLAELKECRERHGGRRGGPHRADCFKQLDLTEEQQAKIDSIRAAAREAAQDAETREERQQIFERMRNAIEDVLTEEQLAKLEKCRERLHGKFKGGFGPKPAKCDQEGEGRRVRRGRTR